MDDRRMEALLQDCPIIAAVKAPEYLDAALASDCGVIFLLCGDVCTISPLVARAKEAGKWVFVHMDRVSGLSARPAAVDFIAAHTAADGIISTQPQLIKHAASCGLLTVLRFFVLDSMALDNLQKQLSTCDPGAIEIMPGLMPRVIRNFCRRARRSVIAGGLIEEKEDVIAALSAGAVSVSTTKCALWAE